MHFTLADLHHYVLAADKAALDAIEMRAAEAKAQEIERLVRDCMARMTLEPEPETVPCTRPTISHTEALIRSGGRAMMIAARIDLIAREDRVQL